MRINIVNKSKTPSSISYEEKDFEDKLLDRFQKELIGQGGQIDVYHNLTIYQGGPRHDIDLLLIGDIENYTVDIDGNTNVRVQRFCTIVEVKSHDISGIHWNDRLGGNGFSVNRDDHLENVTIQNEDQKNKLLRPFFYKIGIKPPYITNLIWFSGATDEEIANLTPNDYHNAFGSNATFKEVITRIARQQKLIKDNGFVDCWSGRTTPFLDEMFGIFGRSHTGRSLNTLKSMNLFSKENGDLLYRKCYVDDKLTIFEGRAGTGKTISLLQLAAFLCGEKQRKCLFLTYNKALVSDIKHILSFAPYLWKNQIEILSVHKFFKDMALLNGFWSDTGDFAKDYNRSLGLLNNEEFQQITHEQYDYAFIDEAQDWRLEEKEILLKLFRPNQIVVADGVDQFIRSSESVQWNNGQTFRQERRMSLRQKSNLVNFVNAYSNLFNIGWSVEVNPDLPGGQVFIRKNYNSDMHSKLVEDAKEVDCTEYDFLFLVPPQMVKDNQFIKLKKYEERNIHLFDGTNDKLRDKGYDDPYLKQCRLYQYDSCRGLEGWTTICLRFDELINYKLESGLTLDQAYLWSLMPLTRAIDTMVITLKDPNSDVGKIFKQLAKNNPDCIHWQVD